MVAITYERQNEVLKRRNIETVCINIRRTFKLDGIIYVVNEASTFNLELIQKLLAKPIHYDDSE
jgi:hypothetical protein